MDEITSLGMRRARTYGEKMLLVMDEITLVPLRPYQVETVEQIRGRYTEGHIISMTGSDLGMKRAQTYGELISEYMRCIPYRLEVQICDMCGCAHYSHLISMCYSCFDAVQGVHMARMHARFRAAMDRVAESAVQAGKSFRRAGEAIAMYCAPIQSIGRVVRHLEHNYPVVIDLECTGGQVSSLDRIRRMMYGEVPPVPQWPKFDLECMVDDTAPVPPKRKNRGPAKRGEWWNRNR